ncbi:hypothetical protein NL676_014956 [Syzygium grande]|nr:hypothetical protein NL676_014956 [Syzygium grande]
MDDKFDKTLELALKSYRKFYHLKVTGKLDCDTVKQMSARRCGVPDLVHPRHAGRNATNLAIPEAIPLEELRGICSRAFQKWANVTVFTFSETSTGGSADIVIGFYRGNLGDGNPFDGPGNVLGHAFSPTHGRFRYDADEQWSAPN